MIRASAGGASEGDRARMDERWTIAMLIDDLGRRGEARALV
jgi:hypothetical protein